ncbi:MAG: hypothetical protein HYZ65_03620 [Burkholderiales bacterium]|nr:hypothetical protein [Burkholderiales bacterium]
MMRPLVVCIVSGNPERGKTCIVSVWPKACRGRMPKTEAEKLWSTKYTKSTKKTFSPSFPRRRGSSGANKTLYGLPVVIPAQAGIQRLLVVTTLDSRLRGNDKADGLFFFVLFVFFVDKDLQFNPDSLARC